jgi:hypothetical protein
LKALISGGANISSQTAAIGNGSNVSTSWQYKSGQITTPANAGKLSIRLWNCINTGWLAFDDVMLRSFPLGGNIAPNPGFESAGSWSTPADGSFPATSLYRGSSYIAAPRTGSFAYANSNLANGQLSYDPTTGLIRLWRDEALALSWTDPTPLKRGAQVRLSLGRQYALTP